MNGYTLKQACLTFLDSANKRESGWITREVSDALDISIYQARLLLLALQAEGCVRQIPGRKPGRGAAIHWGVNR